MKSLALLILLALFLSLPAPGLAKELPEIRQKVGRFWLFMVPVSGDVSAGYTNQWKQRRVQGGVMRAKLEAEPAIRYKRGRFAAKLPLSVSWRETSGFSLRELRLAGGVRIEGRLARGVELFGEAGGRMVLRPGWPDLYQPQLDGSGSPVGLSDTDRYSYGGWHAQGGVVMAHALGHTTLSGGFARRVYTADPTFDPILAPTHLAPYDRDSAELVLRTNLRLMKGFKVGLRLGGQFLWDPLIYARDAGTGETHANPGGAAANPRQEFFRWSVGLRASGWIPAIRTRATLRVGLEQNQDLFQDYYTWWSPTAGLSLRVRPWDELTLEAGYSVTWRRYTSSGYQAGANHPPLKSGEVREATTQHLSLVASYGVLEGALEPYLELSWRGYSTNYPDYRPYVFPELSAYDIRFDYSWFMVMAGAKFHF